MHFRRFIIVGPGLIGGSVGMALKRAQLAEHVVGVGRRQSSLDAAKARGAVDETSLDPEDAADEADFVLLCTRVALFADFARRMAPRMAPGGIISDAGSTKEAVVHEVERAIADANVSFVGAHPIAGSEQQGVAAANPDLFRGQTCILTPTPASSLAALAEVDTLWRSLGARVVHMSPADHDAVLAQISHLPHLVAAALVNAVDEQSLKHAGCGFASVTRIASGGPGLWRDIFATNRGNVLRALDDFRARLDAVRAALAAERDDDVESFLADAKHIRDAAVAKTDNSR